MIVADTNLIAYYLIEGPYTEHASSVLGRDPVWCAPPQWQAELLNVLWLSIRYAGLTPDLADQAYLGAEAVVNTRERPHFHKILDLALTSGCSPYDCEFVALAMDEGVPLVTNDRKVLAAFPEIAVSIQEFGR
ncbi:MAG: hypothetical protein AVDCRST_MAG89-1028 [uncultured Gemmatimonadetes bacterium]|uniref:PIN domain-containing protein n=1 Tax=uncultured Gemmatimonadota bacterium TaxID=203437 RepID=A0A6J4KLV7_9BACT|nr:MAG: hypothetical protein AVDCRST_MAG89-1028 [uncultured Gemmatimonadota bacterium]